MFLFYVVFFFFKQKTAYDMRISDWSSDVCSSDLRARFPAAFHSHVAGHHPSFVVVRLVALSARIRVRPAGPARCTALFDGVDGHRPLSRRNQLSQRDEYMDRHRRPLSAAARDLPPLSPAARSEEHTSELQSLMRISYAVFC